MIRATQRSEKVVGLCPQSVFVTLENLDCAPRPQGSGVGWSGATGGCGPGAQPRAMSCVVWLLPRYDALSSTAVAMATMDRSEMARASPSSVSVADGRHVVISKCDSTDSVCSFVDPSPSPGNVGQLETSLSRLTRNLAR